MTERVWTAVDSVSPCFATRNNLLQGHRVFPLGIASSQPGELPKERKTSPIKAPRQRSSKRIRTISTDDLPAVCGVHELAAYLRVGKNTAYELVQTNQIPAVRVGRQFRIRRESVLEFLGGKN